MAQIICFNVFPNKRNLNKMRNFLVNDHGFEEKENRNGSYFYLETSSLDAWQIKTMLNAKKYKYRSYDKRYERSGNYRKKFFEYNKGPYHCAYCGRRVKGDNLEVDHLIPVAKAKKEIFVRTCMHIVGITNVNDPKNLVSSCSKCNRKKSDSMGWWVIKGMFGRYKKFWIIRNIVLALLIILAVYIIFFSGIGISAIIMSFIDAIKNNIK